VRWSARAVQLAISGSISPAISSKEIAFRMMFPPFPMGLRENVAPEGKNSYRFFFGCDIWQEKRAERRI
jgi:hypothetical protein